MPGNRYSTAGRTAATAATADHTLCSLWNPHASKPIYVREIWVFSSAATAYNIGVQRISTRGTPGSTVTPDADNAFDRLAVPPSGALLDLAAFTVQPTQQGPYMLRAYLGAAVGAGAMFIMQDEAIKVPFGTGLAVNTTTALAAQASDVTYIWDE